MPLQPSVQGILPMLTREKNLVCILRLHSHLINVGLSTHVSLGNHLIFSLLESGSTRIALDLFNIFPHLRTEHIWNSLIIGLVKHGCCRHALLLYHEMQETCHRPNGFAFVALLKACIDLDDVAAGCAVHVEIDKCGLLERDLFVGNTLVDMYAKCGSLAKAQEVFNKLPRQDVVSWNALMTGYAKHEHGEKALQCFAHMQDNRVSPNTITFVCCLKACGSTGAVQKGREIHAEISRLGLFEGNPVVGNALVNMYAKCGWLVKAQETFDKLRVRNVIAWNALIAGFCEHDHGEEALNIFEKMLSQGVSPNEATFPSVFKCCGSTGAIEKGIEFHAEVARKSYLERDVSVGNALVDMYTKCSLHAKAQEVFDKLPLQDVISWTALIAGYANYEQGELALDCFRKMQLAGVSPSAVTFVCSLKACSISGAIDEGKDIHAELARKGFLERDLSVGNALVDMYIKCGSLTQAREVFDVLPVRDIISWTTLIGGYAENNCSEEALICYRQMQNEGISPNSITYVCSLKASSILGSMIQSREIHSEIAKKEFVEQDLIIGNMLVDMYAKNGWLAKAQEVFDRLPACDVVSWTALIKGYAEHECGEEALLCFEQMQLEKVFPNAATLICSLKACHSIGATDKGRELHGEIVRKGLLHRDVAVGNALIDMYAKCGMLAKAQEVFDVMRVRDTITWNSLIAGFVQIGEITKAFCLFYRMRREGEQPDLVTFASVLNACSHAGLAGEGQAYFEAMSKDYGMSPALEHHSCMVSLLSNAGHVEEAIAMILKSSLCPDHVIWQTVLDACHKWGNFELGRMAYEQVVLFDSTDASPYVSFCNMYADHSNTQKRFS